MYEHWKIEKWETALSECKHLAMFSLFDDASNNKLIINLGFDEKEFDLIFSNYPAYRNILEEYRLELWDYLDKSNQRCGNTFIVNNSPWLSELVSNEPLIEFHNEKLKHYVITTGDDVIEVLSNEIPKLIEK